MMVGDNKTVDQAQREGGDDSNNKKDFFKLQILTSHTGGFSSPLRSKGRNHTHKEASGTQLGRQHTRKNHI